MMFAGGKNDDDSIFDASFENELKKDSLKKRTGDSHTGDSIMNNETFSFHLENGTYMANFAYTPSSRVGNQLLFKGILDGKGDHIGKNCVVRTNLEGTKESWQGYVDVRDELKSIQEIFDANNCPCNFHVPKSALANMDKAAFPSKVFSMFGRWHQPVEDEWVFVDLYRKPHMETLRTGSIFSAISHISLKQNKNKCYLTNFRAFNYVQTKGKSEQICITDADMSTDIAAFERTHLCTDLCSMEIPFIKPELFIAPHTIFDFISSPASAPVIGDFNFWSREPFARPPPYSEHPPPSAPPISYEYPPFYPDDFFLRSYSVG